MYTDDPIEGANETLDNALSMLLYRLVGLFFLIWSVVNVAVSGFTIHTGNILALVIACLLFLTAELRGLRHTRSGSL